MNSTVARGDFGGGGGGHLPWMTRPDWVMTIVLGFLGGFIWLRDRSWMREAGDLLPILAGLPLFIWLGRPWEFTAGSWKLSPTSAVLGIVLFPAGILLGSELLLATGWTALLGSWLTSRAQICPGRSLARLLVLPLMSFPWISIDFERVGWWFRLSGAATVQRLLAWGQFDVARHGTDLSVAGITLSVEPACSGIHGLEAMLIAGTVLAYLKLRNTRLYWPNLVVLIGAAWVANVVRITVSAWCAVAMEAGTGFEHLERMHLLAGWLALCAMFVLCWMLFSVEAKLAGTREPRGPGTAARTPWLEMVLLGYCAWRNGDLAGGWWHSPFDRLAWLAFWIWLMPVARSAIGKRSIPSAADSVRLRFMAAALLATFLGDLTSLNFSHHLGLALAVMSLVAGRVSVLWGLSLIGWLPAAGWGASRLGLDPGWFGWIRVLLASSGSAWALAGLSVWPTRRSRRNRENTRDLLAPGVSS